MQQHNVFYNLWFCTAVCVVSAVCVSVTAVMLKERQELNAAQDKKRNVLVAAGLAGVERDAHQRGDRFAV